MNGMWIELPFDVEYDYSPGEAKVMYPNDKAYPGSDPELVVCSVKKGGIELIDVLSDEEIAAIERSCWDEVQSDYERRHDYEREEWSRETA